MTYEHARSCNKYELALSVMRIKQGISKCHLTKSYLPVFCWFYFYDLQKPGSYFLRMWMRYERWRHKFTTKIELSRAQLTCDYRCERRAVTSNSLRIRVRRKYKPGLRVPTIRSLSKLSWRCCTWLPSACLILRYDPELILWPLPEVGHCKRGIRDRDSVDDAPTHLAGVPTFNDVACDGAATIWCGRRPVKSHGVGIDVSDVWLAWGTRDI